MEELEIEMYIRTIKNPAVGDGVIGKIKYVNMRNEIGKIRYYYSVWKDNKRWFEITKKDKVKSSYNPIDLLEEGDVVVVDGMKYEIGLMDDDKTLGIITNIDDNVHEVIPLTEVKIVGILTKELFNSNVYKIGE